MSAALANAIAFANEALDLLAVGKFDCADGERRRDAVDKAAERGNRQLPDFDVDRFAALGSNHARPRRRSAWQSVEAVARRGLGRANELAAAIDELAS